MISNYPIVSSRMIQSRYHSMRPQLDQLVTRMLRRSGIQELSMAVIDGPEVVWTRGFGYADALQTVPTTPETHYEVGAISHFLTAVAVMQLVEQGLLCLNAPLATYLSGCAIQTHLHRVSDLTIRDLLTYQYQWLSKPLQGIPGPSLAPSDGLRSAPYSTADVITDHSGFALLEPVIEAISGCSFIQHMNTAILQPLGATRSSFSVNDHECHSGTTAFHTTVLDMARFASAVFSIFKADNHPLLKACSLAEMLQIHYQGIPFNLDQNIGLGCLLGGLGCDYAGQTAWQVGSTSTGSGMLLLLPEQELAVVVLAHATYARPLIEQIAINALQMAIEYKTSQKPLQKPKPRLSKSIILSTEQLAAYAGCYTALPTPVTLYVQRNSLYMNMMGRRYKLIPQSDHHFVARLAIGKVPLYMPGLTKLHLEVADKAGHRLLILLTEGRRQVLGERYLMSDVDSSLSSSKAQQNVQGTHF